MVDVCSEPKSGEVLSILDDWMLPAMDLWVIYPAGRLTSAKARAFVKWFEKTVVMRSKGSLAAN